MAGTTFEALRYEVGDHVARITIDREKRRRRGRRALAEAKGDDDVWDQDVETSLRLLHPLLTIAASTEDAAEGIAAFAEKRAPEWRGR